MFVIHIANGQEIFYPGFGKTLGQMYFCYSWGLGHMLKSDKEHEVPYC